MGFFNSGKQFQTPTEGAHQAVLGSVLNMGEVDGPYGVKDQVILCFLLDEVDEDSGEPLLSLQYLTKSTDEKSNLRKSVIALKGGVPANFDWAAFDLNDLLVLLGKNVSLTLTHVEKDDRVKAKLVLVSKSNPKAAQVIVPEGWVPPKGLTKDAIDVYTYETPETPEASAPEIDDSDIPF
jgi:hypothetical protein